MDTEQLLAACNCENFIGVFALDQLPYNINENSKFIVNTDSSNLPGRHWIAVDGNHVFEPTGYYYPSSLIKHLYLFFDKLELNYESFQNPFDNNCGLYCIYYLHFLTMDLIPYAYNYNSIVVSSFVHI